MKIAVILPVIDESARLAAGLADLIAVADKVVVADGGSTDNSREIAASMGAEVVRAVEGAPDMEVVAQIELGDSLETALRDSRAEVLVDFTVPESTYANILTALDCQVIPLVGTTGLGAKQLDAIAQRCAQQRTPCLIAPNFALGAVLMMRFAAEAAKYLPDVEILEYHHERLSLIHI